MTQRALWIYQNRLRHGSKYFINVPPHLLVSVRKVSSLASLISYFFLLICLFLSVIQHVFCSFFFRFLFCFSCCPVQGLGTLDPTLFDELKQIVFLDLRDQYIDNHDIMVQELVHFYRENEAASDSTASSDSHTNTNQTADEVPPLSSAKPTVSRARSSSGYGQNNVVNVTSTSQLALTRRMSLMAPPTKE
jgi:hypothetical protein